jgi:hypothetical protein
VEEEMRRKEQVRGKRKGREEQIIGTKEMWR